MHPEREKYLNLRTKPGKVTAQEAAWHLGFLVHEIPMLLAVGLLKPLGKPSENGCKYFSPSVLDKLSQNVPWLNRACDTVTKYWKDRNLQRPTRNAQGRWTQKRFGGAIRHKSPKPLAPRTHRLKLMGTRPKRTKP